MEEERTSFGSKLASLGKAAVHEIQRNAHLASLKAKIEKLKLVDVHKAQYALGRKAHELRVAVEKFGAEYDEIAATEKSIADKRAGVPANHSASNMELVKGAAISVKMKAEAEGLELKLKQMFVALGGNVEGIGEAVGLESEMAAMQAVRSHVEELEKKYATYSKDHAAQAELKSLSLSVAKDACNRGGHVFWRGWNTIRRIPAKLAIPIGLLLLVIGIIAFIKIRRTHTEAQNDEASSTRAPNKMSSSVDSTTSPSASNSSNVGKGETKPVLGITVAEFCRQHPGGTMSDGLYSVEGDPMIHADINNNALESIRYIFHKGQPSDSDVKAILNQFSDGQAWTPIDLQSDTDDPWGESKVKKWVRDAGEVKANLDIYADNLYVVWIRTKEVRWTPFFGQNH